MKMPRLLVIVFCILTLSSTRYSVKEKVPNNMHLLLVNKIVYTCYIPSKYRAYVLEVCDTYKVPIYVLSRLIEKESNWNYKCINYNYNGTVDKGLVQINSSNIEYFSWKFNHGVTINPFNPWTSIRISAQYLHHLFKQFGNWKEAVMAYNAGPTRVSNDRIPITTKQYAKYILHFDFEPKGKDTTNERFKFY